MKDYKPRIVNPAHHLNYEMLEQLRGQQADGRMQTAVMTEADGVGAELDLDRLVGFYGIGASGLSYAAEQSDLAAGFGRAGPDYHVMDWSSGSDGPLHIPEVSRLLRRIGGDRFGLTLVSRHPGVTGSFVAYAVEGSDNAILDALFAAQFLTDLAGLLGRETERLLESYSGRQQFIRQKVA
ncbi:MAG: hypothetical protein ABH879_06080 [archaeon]